MMQYLPRPPSPVMPSGYVELGRLPPENAPRSAARAFTLQPPPRPPDRTPAVTCVVIELVHDVHGETATESERTPGGQIAPQPGLRRGLAARLARPYSNWCEFRKLGRCNC